MGREAAGRPSPWMETTSVKLAIFDLDNTLISGDSDHSWGDYLIDIGAVDARLTRKPMMST